MDPYCDAYERDDLLDVVTRLLPLLCVLALARQGGHDDAPPATRPASAPASSIPKGTELVRPAPGKEPKLVFEKTEHHFGVVDAGAVSTAPFPFANEGRGPLQLHQVRPTCGCVLTSVEVDGKPYMLGASIEPGSKGTIQLQMTASWRAGEKHTFVDVLTNDPAFPPTSEAPFGHVKLHVDGRIVRSIEMYRENGDLAADGRLDFGAFHYLSPPKGVVELRSTKSQAFEIVGVGPPDPRFTVTTKPVNESKTAWRVVVEPKPGLPLGPFLFPLTFQINPDTPGTMLFVAGQIRGALEIEPGLLAGLRLAMPRDRAKPPSAKLTLKSSAGPISIQNARFADPTDFKPQDGRFVPLPGKIPRDASKTITDNLEFETRLSDEGKTAILLLRVKPTMPEGFFNCLLLFQTGVPGGPEEIAVPVTGFGWPASVK